MTSECRTPVPRHDTRDPEQDKVAVTRKWMDARMSEKLWTVYSWSLWRFSVIQYIAEQILQQSCDTMWNEFWSKMKSLFLLCNFFGWCQICINRPGMSCWCVRGYKTFHHFKGQLDLLSYGRFINTNRDRLHQVWSGWPGFYQDQVSVLTLLQNLDWVIMVSYKETTSVYYCSY